MNRPGVEDRLAIVELTPLGLTEVGPRSAARLHRFGGFPDGGVLRPRDYPTWQMSYVTLMAQRDLPAWGLPARPAMTERLLRMIAASHGAILNQAFGFALLHPWHLLLFLGPLAAAGLTAFALLRMWILTFQGLPREPEPFLRAEEAQPPMTMPLLVLVLLAVTGAWGLPPWDPRHSGVGDSIHLAQPASVQSDFGTVPEQGEVWHGGAIKPPAPAQDSNTTSTGISRRSAIGFR